ncbi:MAG: hypothetical protein ACXVDL_03460, partial [Bacteroidia bacterium]
MDTTVYYSKRFKLWTVENKQGVFKTIYIYGNKGSDECTATLVLYPKGEKQPQVIDGAFYIPVPVERVACLGTVYTTMLEKLGMLDRLVAVENAD